METSLEPGTIVAGRYRVNHKIGHGGMGAVYQVEHIHTEEKLALKLLHPQVLRDANVVERFRREARAPARITSEHVARVTDADTAPDLEGSPPFYVMELLRGRDLERIIREDGPLSPPLVVEYLRQMARALDKAHAIGIVHRDLKPENLFLTQREDGSPCIKLLDFGIARLADAEGGSNMSTQAGYIFGTPNYMAPEQTTGDPTQVGPHTDIWSVGLLAFKLLVGEEYFTAKTRASLYAQILAEQLPTPTERGSKYGPGFDEWFARCVSRLIEARFESAGSAALALAHALGVSLSDRHSSAELPAATPASAPAVQVALSAGTPVNPSLPTELPAGLPRPAKNRALVIAGAAGALVLLIGIGAAIALLTSSSAPPSYGIVTSASSASAASSIAAAAVESSAPPAASGEPESPAAITPITPITTAADPKPHAKAASSAAKPAPAPPAPSTPRENPAALNREQKKRLDALDRLCNQGTYTPAECQSKRQAILRGGS